MQTILSLAALVAATQAVSLGDMCSTSNVQQALPATGSIQGITIDSSSVVATPVYNASTSGGVMSTSSTSGSTGTLDYCNISFSYTHDGRDDKVALWYWAPAPEDFQNRYLATGGGGFQISSGSSGFAAAVQVGAVAGTTDGGFGGNLNTAFLLSNGTINYQALYMFSYQAIGETTIIGKSLASNLFNTTAKIYTYYQGCSEGGRDGWSQVQRYPTEYDGVIAGAPAFRFAQQQVQHLYSNVVEQTLDYYPPPCELERIVNATIEACDPLDGVTDGVVSRTDLCKLNFDFNSTVGLSYSCAASSGAGGPGGGSGSPPSRKTKRQMPSSGGSSVAQNGTVSQQGAEVAKTIYAGLHNLQGQRAYLSYQYASSFGDAATTYNNATGQWGLSIASTGGGYVARYLELRDADNLSTLDNVTYDTLTDWMIEGWKKYEDSLQTTWVDLTDYRQNGGKVLHYHGESDSSIPAGSSVVYHESVRTNMYPDLSFNESQSSLGEWYRLFLVPGAEHCGANSLQPNGPFPENNLQTMIDWVEGNAFPTTLNGTITQGNYSGESRQICAWPLRPLWSSSGEMECVFDQDSFDTWIYDFDAYKTPLF